MIDSHFLCFHVAVVLVGSVLLMIVAVVSVMQWVRGQWHQLRGYAPNQAANRRVINVDGQADVEHERTTIGTRSKQGKQALGAVKKAADAPAVEVSTKSWGDPESRAARGQASSSSAAAAVGADSVDLTVDEGTCVKRERRPSAVGG
jgi:hypothetical protein